MLTAEQNRILTEVGRGTPGGELLRRYWHPVCIARELSPEEPTKAVRILGEDLVLFMDTSGNVGLIADRCPHRNASLLYGRVEKRGISCAYHGWLMNCAGDILETPAEQNDHIKNTVKARTYPVQKFVGFYWTYMGPPACAGPTEIRYLHAPRRPLQDYPISAARLQLVRRRRKRRRFDTSAIAAPGTARGDD